MVDGQNGVLDGNMGRHAAVALRNDEVNDEYDERISACENELRRVRRLVGGANNGWECALARRGWATAEGAVDDDDDNDELRTHDGFIFSRLRHLARRF